MLQAGHPDDSVLELYCMNKLEGNPLDAFEEHLLVCPNCQDRVTETDSFVRGMRSAFSAPEPEVETSHWNRLRQFPVPAPVWAAAAILIVGVTGLVVNYKQQTGASPVAVALMASRGGPDSVAQSGTPLDLDLDVRDIAPSPNNTIEIVDSEGHRVWSGAASLLKDGHLHTRVDSRLAPGQYYVRLADPAGAHREYALRLRNKPA